MNEAQLQTPEHICSCGADFANEDALSAHRGATDHPLPEASAESASRSSDAPLTCPRCLAIEALEGGDPLSAHSLGAGCRLVAA